MLYRSAKCNAIEIVLSLSGIIDVFIKNKKKIYIQTKKKIAISANVGR